MKKGFISIISLLPLLIVAQKTTAQHTTLDLVTISSSLSEKRVSETGRNITIVSGETISKLPVHSLDELLKYIPGVEVQMRGPQGSQSDISMRGGTYQQVLVIVDGLRLNDPNTGHFSAYIPIMPAQVDRIEVLKGASAAVYGSDAVGGVINIITKTGNAAAQKNKKLLRGSLACGEYNLINANLGGFIQSGNLSIDAGVLSNYSTGVAQRGTRGFFHNASTSLGVEYKLNEHWHIGARSGYDSRDFSAQNFYTTFASDTASEKVTAWWRQLRLGYEKNQSKVSINAGYKKLHDKYAFNNVTTANQNASELFQSLLIYQQRLGKATNLITGFNYQNKKIESNDRGNHTLQVAAPFVSLSQKIGSAINLLPSVRVEFIGKNKAEILPQLNASYHMQNVQLRASGGRTIRDADFTERYNNYNKAMVTGGSVGNPWLVPEISWSYEAGFDWFYQSKFRISSTVFQRLHSRLIDWVVTPYAQMPRKDNLSQTGTFGLAKNIAEVTTSGWEADAQYSNEWGNQQRLALNAGMLWLYSKSSEPKPSFYISSHARFLTNFNVQYQTGNATLSLTGIYKARKPQQATAINASVSKDYFLLNGRASYEIVKNRLSAYVQADNILDRKYSDLLGAVMPGRWLQGGISFSLSK